MWSPTSRCVSVETDKAVVEVPSPWSGRIARLFGGKGDLVKVGAPLVEFAEGTEADTGTVVGELEATRNTARRPRATVRAGAKRGLSRSCRRCARSRASSTSISTLVQATGPDGTITRADVERAAQEPGRGRAGRGAAQACAAPWRSA